MSQFIKGYDKGYEATATSRDAEGKAWEKGTGLPCSQSMHSLHISLCSPTQKLSTPFLLGFYGGSITSAWLIKSLASGNWFNLQPLSLPFLNVRWLCKLQPCNPSLPWPFGAFESCLINMTKDHWRNSRVLGAVNQKWKRRSNIHLLLKKLQYFTHTNQ